MAEITQQRIAIYGCIINKDNHILIIKRAPFDSSPNIWEMPGGSLELGEDLRDGVKREVTEETNLNISPRYLMAGLTTVSHRDPTKQIIRLVYLATMDDSDQEVKLSPEHTKYAWVDPKEIPFAPLSDILEEVLLTIRDNPYLFNGRT